jgi:hypothetical protein
MVKIILSAAIVFGGALYWIGLSDQEAMVKCQAKGFSYDVCFQSLNP